MNNKKQTAIYFEYTVDNDCLAIDYIESSLKSLGMDVISVDIVEKERACRNAYGKELDEEEFDSIDSEEDGFWFDDYDFVLKAVIEHSCSVEELLFLVSKNISEYTKDYEESEEEKDI